MKIHFSLLVLILLTLTTATNAQWRDALYENERSMGHVDVTLHGGYANYHGELTRSWFSTDNYSFNGGLDVKSFRNKNFGYRLGFNYFHDLNGSDVLSTNEVSRRRNLSFHTNLYELNAGLELNLIPFGSLYRKFTPYVFGGLDLFYFNPYTDSLGFATDVYLRPLGTEGQYSDQYPDRNPYSLITAGAFFGGGLKGLINEKVVLSLEVNFRYAFSDYIDDVSRTYVDLNTLSGELGVTSAEFAFRGDELPDFDGEYPTDGYIRGNSADNDWFYTLNLGIGIYFDTQERSKPYPFTKCVKHKENNPKYF